MHTLLQKVDLFGESMTTAAIQVRRRRGLGSLELVKRWCLVKELHFRDLAVAFQNEESPCKSSRKKSTYTGSFATKLYFSGN